MHPRARDFIGAALLFTILASLVALMVYLEFVASSAR